jgi:hypothetical protein
MKMETAVSGIDEFASVLILLYPDAYIIAAVLSECVQSEPFRQPVTGDWNIYGSCHQLASNAFVAQLHTYLKT